MVLEIKRPMFNPVQPRATHLTSVPHFAKGDNRCLLQGREFTNFYIVLLDAVMQNALTPGSAGFSFLEIFRKKRNCGLFTLESILRDVFCGKVRCSLTFSRTSSSLTPSTSWAILLILCFIWKTVAPSSFHIPSCAQGVMPSRMRDKSFCCEPGYKAQPWLKVLVEQDLWDNILWIVLLDVSHNLPAPSPHHQPGTCLSGVDGVGRAPCRDATEKRDWNSFVSKLFSVCMRVCINAGMCLGQKPEYSQESSLVCSSEEPQNSVRYPYTQVPISRPFLFVKHNHTLLQPGYSVVAAIACNAGQLLLPWAFPVLCCLLQGELPVSSLEEGMHFNSVSV